MTGDISSGKGKGPLISLLETKLTERFEPSSLEIINESHLHAGHQSGFDGQGESHVRIRIVSRHFRGMNRVDMHRAINTACADELAAGLHAIAIDAKAAV